MANGEGYLRKRGGSWTMTVFLGKDETGKPKQLVKTMKGTEREAQAEMARLIAERNQGVDLKPETVTFNELAKRWLEMKTPDLSNSAARTYELLLRLHAQPVLGSLKLRDLKPLHIEAVKAGVIRKGRSQKLALNVFRLVNAVLKQAVLWQLLARNSADAYSPGRGRLSDPDCRGDHRADARLRDCSRRLHPLVVGYEHRPARRPPHADLARLGL